MVNGPRFRSPQSDAALRPYNQNLILLKWNTAVGDDPLSGDALNGGIGGVVSV